MPQDFPLDYNVEIPKFTGDPKNVSDILRFVEQTHQATHIAIIQDGIILFADENGPYEQARMNIDPTDFLSLNSPEVVEILSKKIAKGYHFDPDGLGIYPD